MKKIKSKDIAKAKNNKFIEKRILHQLLNSSFFIDGMDILRGGNYLAETPNTIIKYIFGYFDKHGAAPTTENAKFEFMSKAKAKANKNNEKKLAELEDVVSYIDEIENTPDLPDPTNHGAVKGILVIAQNHFKDLIVQKHFESISESIEEGQYEDASTIAHGFREPSFEKVDEFYSHDFKGDEREMSEALNKLITHIYKKDRIPLTSFKGPIGDMLNPLICRGDLVCVFAPEKRGKTYFLLDILYNAVYSDVNVALFQVGDMDTSQQLARLQDRLHIFSEKIHPYWSSIPDCVLNQNGECPKRNSQAFNLFDIYEDPTSDSDRLKMITKKQAIQYIEDDNPQHIPCTKCNAFAKRNLGTLWVEKRPGWEALDPKRSALLKKRLSNTAAFRIKSTPVDSTSVTDIEATLTTWEREGFIPEIILIDYSDLLKAEGREERLIDKQRWKDLRMLTQGAHRPCVITPSQTNAAGMKRNVIDKDSFSENKSKLAQATSVIGLNQDASGIEQEWDALRINVILDRNREYNDKDCVLLSRDLKTASTIRKSSKAYGNFRYIQPKDDFYAQSNHTMELDPDEIEKPKKKKKKKKR